MPETTPDAQDPNTQAATQPATEPAQSTASSATAQPDIAGIINQAVSPIVSRIAALEGRLSSPGQPSASGQTDPSAAPALADGEDLDKEIQLRKDQLGQIRRGEIDAAYEPEVTARMQAAIAKKEGREIMQREGARSQFVAQYNGHLAKAYEEFPELRDTNSELYKETVKILSEDRQHSRIQQSLASKGRAAEKIDYASLDTRINLRAAREAYAIVSKRSAGRPVSQNTNPNLAKTGLERGTGSAPAADDDIAALEAAAIQSGDPNAWTRYIRARDTRLKTRTGQTV